MRKAVYMDHAATTPVNPRAVEAMLPFFSQRFGNPSSVYALAQEARQAVEEARQAMADILGCSEREVIFTSGGTESDNIAIKGAAYGSQKSGNHIITSAIEHHAVLETCQHLERAGFEVTYLPVDQHGLVRVGDVEKAITDRTVLITIMLANNEMGTVEPIAEIGQLVKEWARSKKKIAFHTDAVQAAGALDINVEGLGVDMLSLSAHKFYGPKGVGIFYLRRGTVFTPQQSGGSQERNRRAGTENVPGIVGAAEAIKLAAGGRESYSQHCQGLRDRLIRGVLGGIEGSFLTGHPIQRLSNNASFCFPGVEGESILLSLDFEGVAASSGSACTSASLEPSHVMLAMGISVEVAHSSLRFSLGTENTEEEVDYVISILPGIVNRLRAMSPLAAER